MATATASVTDRVRDLTAEVRQKRQAHDDAEARLSALLAIRESEDAEAFHRAAIAIPTARVAVSESAADALLAEALLADARKQARATAKAELEPQRRKLIGKLHDALRVAEAAHVEIQQFDDRAEAILDGARLPPVGWPGGGDVNEWFKRIG